MCGCATMPLLDNSGHSGLANFEFVCEFLRREVVEVRDDVVLGILADGHMLDLDTFFNNQV